MTKQLTRGQRALLDAVHEDRHGIFHRRVVQPLFDAGFIWPKTGNFLFWVIGCNGHASTDFVLTRAGYAALVGQLELPLAVSRSTFQAAA